MEDIFVVKPVKDGKGLTESLGISAERATHLSMKVLVTIQESTTYTEALVEITSECENINEVAYVCMVVGRLSNAKDKEDVSEMVRSSQ